MKEIFKDKSFYYILIIIIISFFLHSSVFSPIFNSDDAVTALMIRDFKLPQDIYYWEANRWGSLIPLIGQFFFKILNFTIIQSEAISHYLILILGFIGFTSLFKSSLIKVIFAIAWFLPPIRMIDILKLSQGEQYAIIGITVFILNRLYVQRIPINLIKKHVALITCSFCSIITVWVSDLGIISIGIILGIFILIYLKNNRTSSYIQILKMPETYYIFFTFFLGAIFIIYAKHISAKQENFYSFLNYDYVKESFKIFLISLKDLITFKAKEPFTSLYLYIIITISLIVIYNIKKLNFSTKNSIWTLVFLIDFIIVFCVIITSVWSYLNGVPRRYFVCSYISLCIVSLTILDNLDNYKYKKAINYILITATLIGGFGTLYNFKYVFPKTLKSANKIAYEFNALGKIGIISNYWNSYINSAANPEKVIATPNDKSVIRNQSYVDSVFSQPKLFLIRDSWLDSFPDTLEQFGYTLIKIGKEFKIANSFVCNYKKIKTQKIIFFDKMTYNNCNIEFDKVLKKNVLEASFDCYDCKEKYIVYGPYIPIGIGRFTARFHIKTDNYQNEKTIALFDIAVDGLTQLSTRKINKTDCKGDDYIYIDLNFETKKRYNNIEFRIFYIGNANLYFDKIELIEI